MKTLLVFAHWEEAKSVVQNFDAKLSSSPSFFRKYSNDQIDILVTGMGILNMQAAVVHYFSTESTADCALNVGLAGSALKTLHSWFAASSIHCDPFKTHYPDPIFSKLPYATLHTVHQPATESEMKNQPDSLFDMEGYGFVSGAKRFLQNHQFHLLKFVSDHDGKSESIKKSLNAYNDSVIKAIETALAEIHHAISLTGDRRLYHDLETAIKNFSNKQKLSFTQTQQLLEHCVYLVNVEQKLRVDSVLADSYLNIPDRDRRFKEICKRLYADE
ncbi:hypothetical protein JCM31826_17710 [Thermaurantimonas aggregans]|uniref:Nucleoside phosphorylase domain-containing protein n=1 Tax=Thermaurantimonas aggregans TaxID=2173829 RepID=A0A401XMP4_9FLAO|nr:hypothetical protein [Thermaurantimonas aggregans]MCX8149415.1 hypothetical protein [Thermaurantimonas aggregans]GCD78289.1 hypothetical protein JCM31826_17710 [Thermaurantimonas aggregans]